MSAEAMQQMIATTMAFVQKIREARPRSPQAGIPYEPFIVSDGDVIAAAILVAAFGNERLAKGLT